MRLGDIAKILSAAGEFVAFEGEDVEVLGGTADSRQVKPGMLFCAIHGAKSDGNRYIAQALRAGAIAVLSDATEAPVLPVGIPLLRVRSGRGYQSIAKVAEALAGFPAHKLRLIGITGTCGKTTTAFLLRAILRAAGKRVGMIGTVVYDDGVCEHAADRTTPTPFELQELFSQMLNNGVEYVVMEVSSAALDQERTGTAKFDAAVFTNFSRDHLDYHGTMEAYYECKRALFTRFLKPGAPAIINLDDAKGRELARELDTLIGFSLANTPAPWKTLLTGCFNEYNATCAGLTARAIGIPDEVIAQALASCAGAPGRLERIECPNGVVAFVDYAHTPEEITKALEALRPLCHGKLGIVFGCGGDRDRGKRPQMAQAASLADCIWVTSDNPRTEKPADIIADILPGIPKDKPYVVEEERKDAITQAICALHDGDFLLIAGKGHEDYQEINGVHYHFSDSEVVRQIRVRG